MKKFSALNFSLFIFACCFLFAAFQGQQELPVQKIQRRYMADLETCRTSIENLNRQLRKMDGEKDLTVSRRLFREARLAFKTAEPLAAYYDPEFIRNYINGAPLPSLEFNSPSLSILDPSGFQPLEEVLFAEDALEQKEHILQLSGELWERFKEFNQYQRAIPVQDRHIFEAVRFELIRIFTLGVSGFDSPVILYSLPESEKALKASSWLMAQYLPSLKEKDKALAEEMEKTFSAGVQYLRKNTDFDKFNRVEFLTYYLNPLFRQVLRAQLALGVETIYEITPAYKKQSFNYLSENIFDEDFLNPFYYTRMSSSTYSAELVDLGKVLFFDPVLSSNNQRSCASCHNPELAFSDGQAKSLAMDFNGTLDRNSPGLINAVYSGRFFYDLRTEELEDQVDHVVTGNKEFHTSYSSIVEKLAKSPDYVQLFKENFADRGANALSPQTVSTALAAYLVSLRSFNSPFDKYVRGEGSLPAEAIKGANLFMGKAGCATCHFAPVFSGLVPPLYQENESEVLGVPATKDTENPVLDHDPGRAKGILKEQAHIYNHSFKTTTVRNVALTAPYMHNGVYSTLEEVVDFYNKGGGIGLGLDVPNQTLPPDPLELTAPERQAIVKFMESLSDTTGLTSPPARLPAFPDEKGLNARVVGGVY